MLPDTPLYKYFTIGAFMQMYGSKTIRFSKITDWLDKFEGFRNKFSKKISHNGEHVEVNCVFGSCWSQVIDAKEFYKCDIINAKESKVLHWCGQKMSDTSGCGNIGVRGKSTLGKICSVVEGYVADKKYLKFIHGEVEYDHGLLPKLDTTADLFHKIFPLSHEREYRFLVIDTDKTGGEVAIPLNNPFEIFDEFLISPTIKCFV